MCELADELLDSAQSEAQSDRATNAISYANRGFAVHEIRGDTLGIARARTAIGNIHLLLGDYPSSLEAHTQAMEAALKSGTEWMAAASMHNIAGILNDTGDYPAALEYYQRALEINERVGHMLHLANNLNGIAMVMQHAGDVTSANQYYIRSLDVASQHNLKPQIATSSFNIGINHFNAGEYAASLASYQRALDIQVELKRPQAAAHTRIAMGKVYLKLGNVKEAQSILDSVIDLTLDGPMTRITRSALIAEIKQAHGDYEGASVWYNKALAECDEFGLRNFSAEVHKNLRDLALKNNDLPMYVKHNDAQTRITEDIKGRETTARLAMQEAERRIANERELQAKESERIAKERERERAVLYSTLPKHIADRVIRGEVVNDHIESAAVMFFDIVGFTTITNKLTSQQTITLLDKVFTICDEACSNHNVTRIKTIGDSFMAVAFPSLVPTSSEFQIPSSSDNTSLNASSRSESLRVASSIANAALQIVERIRTTDISSLRVAASGFESLRVAVRVGLHCGPVTAGILGTERLQYDVWGDTVNIASRMESTSEPNKIHVTEQFANALTPLRKGEGPGESSLENSLTRGVGEDLKEFKLDSRGSVEIKGVGVMNTFWLTLSH